MNPLQIKAVQLLCNSNSLPSLPHTSTLYLRWENGFMWREAAGNFLSVLSSTNYMYINHQSSYFVTFEAVFDFVLSNEVLDWFSESLFCRSVSFSFNSLFFFSSCFTVDDSSVSLSQRLSQLVQPSYKNWWFIAILRCPICYTS